MSQGYTMIPAFKHAFTYHHYGHSLEIPPPFPTHNKQTQVALCNLKPDFTQAVPLESERKRLLGGFFFFLNRLPHGGGNKTNPIAGEKLTLLCPGVGKFPHKIRNALLLFPPPGPLVLAATLDWQHSNNDGRGRETSPGGGAPALLLQGHPASPGASPLFAPPGTPLQALGSSRP